MRNNVRLLLVVRSTANKSVELSRAFPTSTISMGNEFAAVRSARRADALGRSLRRRRGERSGGSWCRPMISGRSIESSVCVPSARLDRGPTPAPGEGSRDVAAARKRSARAERDPSRLAAQVLGFGPLASPAGAEVRLQGRTHGLGQPDGQVAYRPVVPGVVVMAPIRSETRGENGSRLDASCRRLASPRGPAGRRGPTCRQASPDPGRH